MSAVNGMQLVDDFLYDYPSLKWCFRQYLDYFGITVGPKIHPDVGI